MYYNLLVKKKAHLEKIICGYTSLPNRTIFIALPCINGTKSYQKITKTLPTMLTLLEAHLQYPFVPFETQIPTDNI